MEVVVGPGLVDPAAVGEALKGPALRQSGLVWRLWGGVFRPRRVYRGALARSTRNASIGSPWATCRTGR